MDDAALVQRLAVEKLEAKAAELRSEWAWVKPVLDLEYGFMSQYRRIEPQAAEYAPEVAAELDAIEQRLRELDEISEDDVTDAIAEESARLSERYDELIETTEAAEVYHPGDRAIAGCIVTVGDEGDFRLYQGLVDRAAEHPDEVDGEQDATARRCHILTVRAGPGLQRTNSSRERAVVSVRD